MVHRFALALATLAVAAPAHAQTGKLWSERRLDAMPLTQVPDFRTLAEQVIPAVVSIQVEQRVKGPGGAGPGQDPLDFFHRYFGGDMPHEYHNRGLGSGFLIDATGLLLTNFHVVEDAESIEVTFQQADGTERKVTAKVLGTAPEYDVALLQTDEKLQAAITYLGNSDTTKIGDWVMAVGNPFGLSHSVSVGIISAKERREVSPSGRRGLYNFLQTDASINPGNSGGPLINMRGEVIGINSAINAAGSGIGFAIPINMVKEMLPDLRAKGKYTRSWIGIKIQAMSPELAQSYGLKHSGGALVSEVVPNSPAAEAKLREGDVILQFDNKDLRNSTDLPLFASMAGVGKTVAMKIWRDGKEATVSVKLKEFPDAPQPVAATMPADGNDLGLVVADVSPTKSRGVEAAHGVIIKEVDPGGLAARAGLRPGDLIVALNGKEVRLAHTFADTVRTVPSGEVLRIKVSRGGASLLVALRKP